MRIILSVGSHNLLLPERADVDLLLIITEAEFVERSYGSSGKWRKSTSEAPIELKVISDEAVLVQEPE